MTDVDIDTDDPSTRSAFILEDAQSMQFNSIDSVIKLKRARDHLDSLLEIIKCIYLNKNLSNDFEVTIEKSLDNLIDIRDDLIKSYMEVFKINDQKSLLENDKKILHLLNDRIDYGSNIIKAKLMIDPFLAHLDKNKFMLKITDKDVEGTIIENIKTWSPEMAVLYENYVIPETKNIQFQYAQNY